MKAQGGELPCCRSWRSGNSSDHRPRSIREGSSSLPDAAPTVASLDPHRDSFRFPRWDGTCSVRSGDQRCPCLDEQRSNVGWYRFLIQTAFPQRPFHPRSADVVPSVPRCRGRCLLTWALALQCGHCCSPSPFPDQVYSSVAGRCCYPSGAVLLDCSSRFESAPCSSGHSGAVRPHSNSAASRFRMQHFCRRSPCRSSVP